jgi:hypothetical protein
MREALAVGLAGATGTSAVRSRGASTGRSPGGAVRGPASAGSAPAGAVRGTSNAIPCPFSRAYTATTRSSGTKTSRATPLKRAWKLIESLAICRRLVARADTLSTISPFFTNSIGTRTVSSTATAT